MVIAVDIVLTLALDAVIGPAGEEKLSLEGDAEP